MSRSVAVLPEAGWPPVSSDSNSIFLPLIPPSAFTWSMASSAPFFDSSPQGFSEPERLAIRPILIVSPSWVVPAPFETGRSTVAPSPASNHSMFFSGTQAIAGPDVVVPLSPSFGLQPVVSPAARTPARQANSSLCFIYLPPDESSEVSASDGRSVVYEMRRIYDRNSALSLAFRVQSQHRHRRYLRPWPLKN